MRREGKMTLRRKSVPHPKEDVDLDDSKEVSPMKHAHF
jgi:hypothetical protein